MLAANKIEMTPDRRVKQALHLVLDKMTELGSMGQKMCLPFVADRPVEKVLWKLPVYNTILHLIRNPMYAWAYLFGKTGARTKVVDGRARRTAGHFKPQ
jgi:hypothetical protein